MQDTYNQINLPFESTTFIIFIYIPRWQIFMMAFYFVTMERHEKAGLEFNHGCLVSVLLQTVYIAKFWWWEAGYFWTLDVINDRAGYYLCWGCIVWMPVLFTFPTYFFILHVPSISTTTAWIIFVVGSIAIALEYKVDKEKEEFKKTDGNCIIWGSKAHYIPVEYVDQQGKVKKSKLITSGFWGTLRHFNYTFEVVISFSWCAVAGFEYGLPPFYYAIFIAGLVFHRIFRDEEKCSRKYGRYWKEYCAIVPYRMIPYVF
jgi:7-dehydrocholesterol reductase